MHRLRFIAFLVFATFGFTSFAAYTPYLDSIFIRLFTGNATYIDENWATASLLVSYIDDNKPTVFYVHGFSENVTSTSVQTVVGAYQDRGDHNVMAVDYRDLAALRYPFSAAASADIGKVIAAALDPMVKAGLDSKKLVIVGHSMGCQVIGFTARNVHFRVQRIIGLDPAGPLFNIFIPHLSSTDAVAVIIIHTDKGWYGNINPSGTVDFYPNCGHRIQPGCPILIRPLSNEDFCSHHRSWRFYAESVMNEHAFVGIKCQNKIKFRFGMCNQTDKVIMGYATPQNATGAYYLWTEAQSPFGVGDNGTVCTNLHCIFC